MPDYQHKTKAELIKELQKLQQECDSLKTSYLKEIYDLRHAKEALLESEERYRLLFENSGEAVLLTNPDGTIYSANPEACRTYGRSEKEICKLGRNGTSDLNDPRLEPALNERKKTGKFKGELNQVRKDGTIFPAEVTSTIFRDTSGNERTSMIVRDISERKLFDKELNLQGEIMKNISEGINLIRVKDEVIVFTNPKFEKMFGYYSGELIGRHASILNATGDKSPEEVKQDIVDTIKSSGEWHGEILNIKKNGDTFWCYVNISVFDHPDFGKVYLSVHTNIGRRKKAEEALQKSEQQYRQLFDQMLNGLMVCEVICDESGVPYDHRFVQGNKAFEQLTGLSLKEQIGRTSKDFGVSWPPEVLQKLYRVAMTGESIRYERFNETLGRLYETRVFSPRKGQFAHIFTDITERKKAEDSLRRALDWQEAIFEGSRDAIFISDQDSRFITVNRAACDLTGYTSKQLLKMRIPDIHDFIDLDAYNLYHQRIFDGEEILSEARVLRSDGTKIYAEFNNTRVFIERTVYMHTSARNITERKRIETSLTESEARFRSIFENSLIGISIARPDGGLLQVNQAYARMYGYENPELLLSEVSDTTVLFANPEERKEVLRELKMNRFMKAQEFELIRRDGSHLFALVSASEIRDTEGKLLYNQAFHLDITERRNIEEKIREASLYARSLIEAGLDPLITINTEGKITDLNSATEKITGIKRAKLIGSDISAYFTEPDKVRKGFKIILSRGSVKNFPLKMLHSSGKSTDVLFNATLYKNAEGEVQGVFADARDITDRKKIEEELRSSKELLERLNHHLNEVRENERALISREIHDELGQSMTALKLDLNRIYEIVKDNQEAVVHLNNMIELVSDTIKNVQRISSDLRPGILDDLGLVPAIEWYCEEFERRTGIKCSQKLENSDYSDSEINLTFFRALQESLTNVIRHAKASSLNVKLHQTQKGIFLTIKDNGIGIPEEKIESHKSLGLISMRERVRQLNGKINISSKKGEGTTVIIFIPSK